MSGYRVWYARMIVTVAVLPALSVTVPRTDTKPGVWGPWMTAADPPLRAVIGQALHTVHMGRSERPRHRHVRRQEEGLAAVGPQLDAIVGRTRRDLEERDGPRLVVDHHAIPRQRGPFVGGEPVP